jgi:hypothetical protein
MLEKKKKRRAQDPLKLCFETSANLLPYEILGLGLKLPNPYHIHQLVGFQV